MYSINNINNNRTNKNDNQTNGTKNACTTKRSITNEHATTQSKQNMATL